MSYGYRERPSLGVRPLETPPEVRVPAPPTYESSDTQTVLRLINVGKVQSPGGDVGILLEGVLPAAWAQYLNLSASGSELVLKLGGVQIKANGDTELAGIVRMTGGAVLPVGADKWVRA